MKYTWVPLNSQPKPEFKITHPPLPKQEFKPFMIKQFAKKT